MWSIFAQALPVSMSPDSMSSWVGMVGTLGFAVWYGYYVTAVLIPKINTENGELVKKIVTDFRDEMKLERDAHSAEMTSQREACQREMEQLVSAFQARVSNLTKPSNN